MSVCGAPHAILLDRNENSRRQLYFSNFSGQNLSEAWYLRLLALNFLISEIDLPNRVHLTPKLQHFVGRCPQKVEPKLLFSFDFLLISY